MKSRSPTPPPQAISDLPFLLDFIVFFPFEVAPQWMHIMSLYCYLLWMFLAGAHRKSQVQSCKCFRFFKLWQNMWYCICVRNNGFKPDICTIKSQLVKIVWVQKQSLLNQTFINGEKMEPIWISYAKIIFPYLWSMAKKITSESSCYFNFSFNFLNQDLCTVCQFSGILISLCTLPCMGVK